MAIPRKLNRLLEDIFSPMHGEELKDVDTARSALYTKCSKCGTEISRKEAEVRDGYLYCRSCYPVGPCMLCKKMLVRSEVDWQDYYLVGKKRLCKDCADTSEGREMKFKESHIRKVARGRMCSTCFKHMPKGETFVYIEQSSREVNICRDCLTSLDNLMKKER
jgi:hypothetical protein